MLKLSMKLTKKEEGGPKTKKLLQNEIKNKIRISKKENIGQDRKSKPGKDGKAANKKTFGKQLQNKLEPKQEKVEPKQKKVHPKQKKIEPKQGKAPKEPITKTLASKQKLAAFTENGVNNKVAAKQEKMQKAVPSQIVKPKQKKTVSKAGLGVGAKPKNKNKAKKQLKDKIAAKIENKQKRLRPQTTELETELTATTAAEKRKKIKANKQAKLAAKKEKVPPPSIFEAVPFDEAKFKNIVNAEKVKPIVEALKILVEQEVSSKKASIFTDYRYFLNIASYKIANSPKRMVKLNLKHSLVDKDDDVVIIVPDLQRGSKVDYEPTIQHYEDLFREAGVENLKIIPFNQLRTEYNTFESLRKFASTYDYFLCDGRIVGQTVGFCGKVFQKPRTAFHSVRMHNTNNLKREIEKSLCRTAFKQLNKGDLISMPVGNHKYDSQQLADNIQNIVSQLKTAHPGGWPNIRSMTVKIDIVGTSSLPIYLSTAQPPAETPYEVGPREQRMIKVKKEANDILSKFIVTKDAKVVKLSKQQQNRKRKLSEMRNTLLTEDDEETPEPIAEVEDVDDKKKKSRKE